MFKEIHQKLTNTSNSRIMVDTISDIIESVKDTAPFKGVVYGINGIEIKAGIDPNGFGWLTITSNVLRSLCKQWFTNTPVDSYFVESVRKRLNEQEQNATVKAVEIDQTTWEVRLMISYAQE